MLVRVVVPRRFRRRRVMNELCLRGDGLRGCFSLARCLARTMRDKANAPNPTYAAKRHVVVRAQDSCWKNGRFGRGMKCCMGALANPRRASLERELLVEE